MGKIFSGRNKLTLILLVILVSAGLTFFILRIQKSKVRSQKVATQTATQAPTQAKQPEIPKVTVESIFATEPANLSELDQNKIIKLIATGDVIPARGVNWYAVKKNNYKFYWEDTADLLKGGDITLIDLEAPIFAGCPLATDGFTFCGEAGHIGGITFAGVDVASIANNHIGNYGQKGINETINLLTNHGVEYAGFGHLGIREVKGVRLGFLGYNGIGVKIPREAVAAEIAESKKKVDLLIISIHWGKEYESLPMTDGNIAPDNPIEIGHLMVDAGADLIVGNHPHWVQGVEIYRDKIIAYAHGNFIFDQTWSEETKEGVIGEYTFFDKKLISVRFHPTKYQGDYQPKLLNVAEGAHILKRMQDASIQLKPNP